MKPHTSNFKIEIKKFGRELDSKIFGSVLLGNEQLNSVTPHYEGSLLKSVMKQLDIESKVEIPVGSLLNYQFGVKVGNTYEYINYGIYEVYESTKKEDSDSWDITCYDSMLHAMKDYESLGITYPITVKNFLVAICTKIGLTLANEDFVNADKPILSELYLDDAGNSLGYTYRDVLDEIAQATGSIICINSNDELEVRYPSNIGTYTTVEGTDLYLDKVDDEEDLDIELYGNLIQNGTPTPTSPIEIETVTGRQEIDIIGKNLFNVDGNVSQGTRVKYGDYGLTFTKSTNRTCRIDLPMIMTSGTYTISMDKVSSTLSGDNKLSIGIMLYTSSVQTIQPLVNGTFTTISSFNQLYFFINNDQSDSAIITIDNIQLEKGSTATSFESCEYKDYEINLGKNLWEGFDYSRTHNQVLFTHYEDGSITASGTASGNCYSILRDTVTSNNWYITLDIGTYTLSGGKSNAKRLDVIDSDGNSLATDRGNGASFTLATTKKVYVRAYITSGTIADDTFYPQIEKGSKATSYSPYKEPIELCKIGNYKDFIRKGTGKNLFNINATRTDEGCTSSISNNVLTQTNTKAYSRTLWGFENMEANKQYTFSCNYQNTNSCSLQIRVYNSSLSQIANTSTSTSANGKFELTFTPTETTFYLRIYSNTTNTSNNYSVSFFNIQLEKSNQFTEYEPYSFKDKWYLYKAIEKIVLNGSENWISWNDASTGNTRLFGTSDYDTIKNYGYSVDSYSNYFKNYKVTLWNLDEQGFTFNDTGNNLLRLRLNRTIADGTTALNTWLSTNNTSVYYVQKIPTTTEITDSELINQLESIRLFVGSDTIITDWRSPIKLTYMSEFETIDEEMLKDVNVNFGEVFGPVNSIVLSRSVESDNIYRKDDESIELNGLTEIKIKDNQILNGNNRDEFIDGIYNKLKGLKYYVNDYVSTGIGYLDLGDFYKVKVENNSYKCLMLNDELDVTQGLEEPIHTEKMEDSETDYKHASKTDRTINQAYIIAKKNDAEIQALASKVVDVSNTISGIGSVSLENAYKGVLHRLEISGNISSLMPRTSLTPSTTLKPIGIYVVVDEESYLLDLDYLIYNNAEEHDTFVYEDGKCWIERINGTTEEREPIEILVDKNSEISIEPFTDAHLFCEYLLDNKYTSTFANKIEVSSELNLLADTLEAKVSQVADDDGNVTSASIILAVNNDEGQATIQADKINLNGVVTANENFKILEDGSMEANNGTFKGEINGGRISINGNFTEQDPYIRIEHPDSSSSTPIATDIWTNGISCYNYGGGLPVIRTETADGFAELSGSVVNAYGFNNVSLKERKKNFGKLENALKIINEIDIYKYNYKEENDDDKKHIGVVIGKDYKYSKEITSKNNEEIDIYSFVSVCCKAIQELQQEIEELRKEIK